MEGNMKSKGERKGREKGREYEYMYRRRTSKTQKEYISKLP